MKLIILLVLSQTFIYTLSARHKIVRDIYIVEKGDVIIFGNSKLSIEFTRLTGRWKAMKNERKIALLSFDAQQTMDVNIEGKNLMEQQPVLKKWFHSINANQSVSLHFIFESADNRFRLMHTYILYSGEKTLERLMSFVPAEILTNERVMKFSLTIPSLLIGVGSDCVVDVPGPFWPSTFTAPDTPYDSLINREITYHSTPDAGFGLVSITNKKINLTISSWLKSSGDASYNTTLSGNGTAVSLAFDNNKAAYLRKGKTFSSDTQQIVYSGSIKKNLNAYQSMINVKMPIQRKTPAWTKEAVILEVLPEYFTEGFKGLEKKLPVYKEIGFNTIYLMPHWLGGYSPIDLYTVDPRYGTKSDLQDLVRSAHALGMRVLFDMVIHGFNKTSPVVTQYPDFFYRDINDTMMIHPAWGSVMTDFMNPAYRKYMEEYVKYDLHTYDIDGYRVDAASYKGPNWRKDISYPAYSSGSGSPLLMQDMLQAMQSEKPESVLLSEVFGPVFYIVSNFSHDNQTEAMSFLIKKIESGNYHIDIYKKHISNVYHLLPRGAARVFFTRNHDTSWFYEFYGYTPLFMSIEAIHALFGIPEVFAGDSNYKFNPDDDKKIFEQYRKLFSARKEFPEFINGEIILDNIISSNADIFAGVRKNASHTSMAVISTCNKSESVSIKVPSDYLSRRGKITAREILSGRTVEISLKKTGTIQLTIQPFDVVLIRFK